MIDPPFPFLPRHLHPITQQSNTGSHIRFAVNNHQAGRTFSDSAEKPARPVPTGAES
jgi:hypothetical protein